MNSSAVGAHNYITWSSIEVVITRRTRNPLALRGPWVRIPPAPPKAKHPEGCFLLYGKSSLQRIPRKKTEKPIRGSIQVSSTNESGVRALALPLTWVLLGTCRQREESPASALPYCFSVFCFWYCIVFCLSSADFRRSRGEKWNFLMFLHSPALLLTADVEDGRLEIGFIVS